MGFITYLSCKNNDAINDYIINLIIQQINKDDINFVKYDNLFVTKITSKGVTEYKYCIIMNCLDDTIQKYIKSINEDVTICDEEHIDVFNYICEEADKQLNKLKDTQYLFTHTDMKTENLFYKENKSNRLKPIIYIADFDKASITYKNIRFYNDITQSGIVKSFFGTDGVIGSILKIDNYNIQNSKFRSINFNYGNDHKFRLSKNFINLLESFNQLSTIELNQL